MRQSDISPPRSRSATAVRWSITLLEPLLTTEQRIEFESEFLELARLNRDWFDVYSASVLYGIVASLPTKDPWRSVVIVGDHLDGATAQWPGGIHFGDSHDADDVTMPMDELERVGIDPLTLALEHGLVSDAAVSLIVAFRGWRDARSSLAAIRTRSGDESAFEGATEAIRWAEHRRRSYRPGVFDSWFEFLTIESANRAACIDAELEPVFSDDDLERDATKERALLDQIVANRGLFGGKGESFGR